MKKILIGSGVVLALIVGGSACGGGEESAPKETPKSAAPAKESKAPTAPKPAPKKELSQADQFKAFVAKNGLPNEKTAVKHVTKVTGADERNDIMDAAEVFTDYKGDMISNDANQGKLIASAFADWKQSKNGLVTVYNASGEILSNGNF